MSAAAWIALALLGLLAPWGWRLLRGPTGQDRALAAHGVLQALALTAAALSVALDQPAWLEIVLLLQALALTLALLTLKTLRYRSLQPRLVSEPDGGRHG